MFSMCGLLCRFLRGWRQTEAFGLMVQSASLKDASLIVDHIESAPKSFPSSCHNGEPPPSLFCQPFCQTAEARQQLLWRENSKQATVVTPKAKVNLARWTLFLSTPPSSKGDCSENDSAAASQCDSSIPHPDSSSLFNSTTNPASSGKQFEDEDLITVLLEASYREDMEESLCGYHVMVEHLAKPYVWKARDVFGVIIHTTPTNLISMIHAFFNNALVIDDDLSIRKIVTVDLVGEPSSLTDPSTISDSVTPGPWSHSGNFYTQMELARAASLTSPGPEEVNDVCSSNPNLSRVASPFSNRLRLSSSFTSSPFRQPAVGTGPSVACFSPHKRGLTTQNKTSTSSPANDSCPASPLVEEDEEIDLGREASPEHDFVEEESDADEAVAEDDLKEEPEHTPNILVYTASNHEYYEDVKETLERVVGTNMYAIYHLTDEIAFHPWRGKTTLLVVCGDVATHVSAEFARYLLSGGKVLSICSDFLNVAVPLFGTVEVQEAAIVSITYNKWKNVQLLHHQHCFHSSPKHKNLPKDQGKKAVNSGAAVSVEPTFVEIKDEYGCRHRLNLTVLAKDDTWGAPSLLVAHVKDGSGRAIFSQVHLEKDDCKSISLNLQGEQLKRVNESRLEILGDLISSHLCVKTRTNPRDGIDLSYTPGYILGKYEDRQKFLNNVTRLRKEGQLSWQSIVLQVLDEGEEAPPATKTFLPMYLTGSPLTFSTVDYFEQLKTTYVGRVVIYADVMASTMNFSGPPYVGNGVVVIANQQTHGKGRQGNAWLSPLGCAMFTLQLHFPTYSKMSRRLTLLQHLATLACVLAVKRLPGYEAISLHVKWPNDIYYLGKDDRAKIGGVIVTSANLTDYIVTNIGCGVNFSNRRPTSCINEAIQEYNAAHGTCLSELSKETFFAQIFFHIEKMLQEIELNGTDQMIAEYYKHWLHRDAQVSVQDDSGHLTKATIVGIDSYGFLLVQFESGERVSLQPDGNSFDMFHGLIYSKSTGT